MIQAAHFDIKTVTGLRQALVLSAEYENEPFPLEGYTLHGSIGTYPRMDLKCSVDENGRARIEWDSVPPGNWKYDVFLISASNDETPLMEGTFTALPRITPVLDDESVNDEVGGVLRLPSGNEGTITLEVDGGFVSKEYAAIAKDAADKAQQALAAIPQVDASGNMTLAGSFSATGGIFNGKLVVNNPNGSMGDGSYNQIYGLTWFYGQVEFRKGGILRGDLWVESGTVRIGANAAFNCSGSGTFAGTVNANGGININTNGNNGTLTLKTSGGVGYLIMDTGEFSISVDYLTLGGQTFVQTLNVAESSLFTGSVTVGQYLKTSSLDAENVEASTINLVDIDNLSCIDLMPYYGSPDEASLIIHPAQTGPGTTDYDIQLYFTYGSSGGFADWLAGPSIQMMRFHPTIGFYNAVSYSNPVVFLGSATFSALLKAQQAEIDQLKINSPLYEEGFLAWQDAGGLSMTRPSITESLYDADNPKAMLNREDNDQRYLQVKSLTAAEYAALGSYSPTTLYRITDADPAAVYLGDLKLSVAAD